MTRFLLKNFLIILKNDQRFKNKCQQVGKGRRVQAASVASSNG